MRGVAAFREFSLKEFTTWRCGGVCRLFAAPKDESEASSLIKEALSQGVKIYALGGGSNVLVQDGRLDAAVVSSMSMNALTLRETGGAFFAEAESGVATSKLLSLSVTKELGGLEFLTGIPGTVGGAIFGNAGACGESLSNCVEWVDAVSENGEKRRFFKEELNFEYRKSPWDRAPLFITKAGLRLFRDNKRNIIKNIRRFAVLKKNQPLGRATAGCVFKNPPSRAAGKLLDECGCKGLSVGAARVCENHANFVENTGGAAAEDIYKLTLLCKQRVFETFGIELEYEIKFIGAFPAPQKA